MDKNNKFAQLETECTAQKIKNNLFSKNYETMSIVFTYVSMLLAIYILAIAIMTHFDVQYRGTAVSSSCALIFFGGFLFIMMLHTKQPLSLFGFNCNNWRYYLSETIVYTIVFCFFITFIKWYVTKHVAFLNSIPVFDYGNLLHMGMNGKFHGSIIVLLALVYVFFIPLQAIIVNGGIQSAIINFVHFRQAKLLSIVGSSLFFAAIHASIDFIYAVSMLIPGLFWALLYARQKSLLGVIVSHVIVGIYAFYFLGYEAFFAAIEKNVFY